MQEIEELRDRNAALALENRALRTENQELRERRPPPSADTEVETTRMTWRAALERCPQLTENQVKSHDSLCLGSISVVDGVVARERPSR